MTLSWRERSFGKRRSEMLVQNHEKISKEMSEEPPTKKVTHFKKRAMGYGKRRSEGVSRATAPNPCVEQPVSKSLYQNEKLAVKVRPEAQFEPPPARTECVADDLYKAESIGDVEVWEDVIFRKSFRIAFSPVIICMPSPEKAFAICLLDLAARTYTNFGKFDMFMGMELSHDDLDERICLPYMSIHSMTEDVLLDQLIKMRKMGRILHPLTTEVFAVTLCFVKQLTGSGVPKPLKRKLDTAKKYCTSNQVSKLCLATAVLQGIAHLEHIEDKNNAKKEEYWQRISKVDENEESSTEFMTAAEQLVLAAGIVNDGIVKKENFTIKDVEALQEYFRGKYQIVVFTEANHKTPVFTGPSLMNKNVIALVCKDNHYQHINDLPQFVGALKYCVMCNVRYNSENQHYNCALRCRLCNGYECIPEPGVEITCEECQVIFYSRQCEKNHRLGGIRSNKTSCGSTLFCENCNTSYKKYKVHRCNETYCQKCKIHRPKGHQCMLSRKAGGGNRAVPEKMIFVHVKCAITEENGVTKEKAVCAMCFRCCPACRNKLPDKLEKAYVSRCKSCSPEGTRVEFYQCISKKNRGMDVLHELFDFLLRKAHERFCIVLHDMPQCFSDALLAYIASEGTVAAKYVTMVGGKLRSMKLKGIHTRVVDSKFFFPVHIRELGDSVGVSLPLQIIPQAMIKEENFGYLGEAPDIQLFYEHCRNDCEKKEIQKYHEELSKHPYVFVDELLRCMYYEVLYLAATILTVESVSSSILGIRLLEESEDLHSATSLAYRRNFVTDGILPLDVGLCAKFRTSFSLTSMYYLTWRARQEGLPIDSCLNVGEYRVPGTPYHVDGFIQPCEKYPRGRAIEINGCYWHAHGCSSVPKMIARRELDEEKIRRQEKERRTVIEQFHEVEVVWDCDIAFLRRDPAINSFMEQIVFEGPCEAANAVYPMRSEVFRYKATSNDQFVVRMRDISCLSGDIMRIGEFPNGELRRIHGENFRVPIRSPEELLSQTKGILYCRVLAPPYLVIPVLPNKLNDHIVYPLCRVCTETDSIECRHSDQERIFTGTWTTFELEVALEHGYIITEVLGAIHWDEWSTYRNIDGKVHHSLFSEYAERLLILDKLATGYPEYVVTDSEKMDYINRVRENEGLNLDPHLMSPCDLLRHTAKELMKLPDVFGKLSDELPDEPTTRVLNTASDLWKLLENPTMRIDEMRITKKKVIASAGKQRKEGKPTDNTVRVVPALVGGQMRARIYRAVVQENCELLYTDESAIIYRCPRYAEDPLKNLGVPAASEISEYFSCAPDSFCVAEETKMFAQSPGFSWSPSQLGNQIYGMRKDMESLLNMSPSCISIRYQAIERNSHFLLEHVERSRRVHNVKPFSRRILPDGSTFPIGYVKP